MANQPIIPDGRLAAAAGFVRENAVFADIGTDHAYLPIFLCESGRISYAVAADVAEGPLARARENIGTHGLSEKIECVLCDGLSGIFPYHPTDIAVCGMGGELIASILGAADWIRDPDIHLILQPMTMQPMLRRWLAENGYAVLKETLASANGRTYPVLLCAFSGEPYPMPDADAFWGRYLLDHHGEIPDFPAYLAARKEKLNTIRAGKHRAGLPTDEEDALLDAVKDF